MEQVAADGPDAQHDRDALDDRGPAPASFGVVELDAGGAIVRANQAFARLVGRGEITRQSL